MPDHRNYVRTKEDAERWLFKIPRVQAVGLGPKFVNGRAVGKLAIQVFVESKHPRASLDPKEIIPEFINGIPTDVLEWHKTINTQNEITVDDCPTGIIENITPISTGATLTHFEIRSPSHDLVDNARVRFTGPEEKRLTSIAYAVTVKDDDTFIIPVRENGSENPPLALPLAANSAGWMNMGTFDNLCCCPSGEIQFVGVTDKVSIGSPGHGLISGDRIKIKKSAPLPGREIYEIKKVDADNFDLVRANPADFGGVATGWRWRKVSLAPTGRITRIEMRNPVVIHSAAHGLVKGDKIIIQTIHNVTEQNLDNHMNRSIAPYSVEIAGPDRFTLSGVDATDWGSPDLVNDFVGSWIKVIEDRRRYERKWGGIRIEMKESETETVERTTTTDASSPLTTRISAVGQAVRVEVKLNTGTLGCIATDNLTGKKVLLSNAHVVYSGTDNDEVHHPNFYTSSRTCSKHKIATRVRQVYGADPANPGITVDAAIARFDPDKRKYDPFIVDIGPVKGTANVAPDEIVNGDYRVWKRGAQTGITEGIIISTDLTFTSTEDGVQWRNQLHIDPVAGIYRGFMSILGDSGSVVVNKDNKVVGLLFKAIHGGRAAANRIADVETALQITIWREGDPVAEGEEPIEPGEQAATVGIPELFASTVAELSASEAGNNLAVIVSSHVAEVINLMETNKKFAAVWQRNHGPELMQQLREVIEARNRLLPASIKGRLSEELLVQIFGALKKYGSEELAAHVRQYEQVGFRLLNYTYEDLLQFLQRNPQLVTNYSALT